MPLWVFCCVALRRLASCRLGIGLSRLGDLEDSVTAQERPWLHRAGQHRHGRKGKDFVSGRPLFECPLVAQKEGSLEGSFKVLILTENL